MNTQYPVDGLRHFAPLVVISGLGIPNDEKSQPFTWTNYTTSCPPSASSITSHPFLESGEKIAGCEEPTALMPKLFWKFAARSHPPQIWNPYSFDVSRRASNAPYLLNIQFTNTRDEFILPPLRNSLSSFSSQSASKAPSFSSGTMSPISKTSFDFSSTNSSTVSLSTIQSEDQKQSYNSHSLLSPLNPSSDLYPNGLMSERWIQKYLHLTPTTFVSLHLINTNLDTKEEQQAADGALIKTINDLKTQLALRNIKLVVIIISQTLPAEDPTLNDRVYYLRKNTGLAARTGMLLLPPSTDIEVETLAEAVCYLAYANSQDFYTGIAKRIRKKRGKNKVALSDRRLDMSPLSHAGWEVRYNFKLAAMAEFRQEIESAIKSYENTYEMALELFETLHPLTETSAQRWSEFRLFLDIVAYKIMKLYFYMGQGNHGYKKYTLHVNSMSIITTQKGFDKNSFSFRHWKASLDGLVADLIDMTAGALISYDSPLADQFNILVPGDNLPRSGYWYLSAAQTLLEIVISKNYNKNSNTDKNNDTPKPQQTTDASVKISGKQQKNDVAVDPYFAEYDPEEFIIRIKKYLLRAIQDFSCGSVANERSVACASYYMGEVCMLRNDFKDAHQHYRDAARMYRFDNWSPLLRLILARLVETSRELGDRKEQLVAELELETIDSKIQESFGISHNATPTNPNSIDPNGSKLSQMMKRLNLNEEDKESNEPLKIAINEKQHYLKFYNSSFTFPGRECHLGLPAEFQISLTCNLPKSWHTSSEEVDGEGHDTSGLYTLQELRVNISGQLGSILIKHNGSLDPDEVITMGPTELKPIPLTTGEQPNESSHDKDIGNDKKDESTRNNSKISYENLVYECEANLEFKPGQKRVFQIAQIPKQLGDAKVSTYNICIYFLKFKFILTKSLIIFFFFSI